MGIPAAVNFGDRFGRLVVLAGAGTNKFKCRMFTCMCDCGAVTVTSSRRLRTGKTKSCGCLRREHSSRQSLSRTLPLDGSAVGVVFAKYRQQAARRGVAFELLRHEVDELIRRDCHYCGASPANSGRRNFRYSGIDRVQPEMGYVAGNVVPCCWPCNRGKGDMTASEFKAWANRVTKFQNQESDA